jgi:hypothetical protein
MGLATNIIFFCLITSAYFQLTDPVNWKTPYTSLTEGLTGKTLQYDAYGNAQYVDVSDQFCLTVPGIGNRCFGNMSLPGLFLVMLGMGLAAAAFGIIPGTSNFPNPYLLFSALGVLLLGFFTFPLSLMTSASMPVVLRVVLIPLFLGGYTLAFISWYKGGSTP